MRLDCLRDEELALRLVEPEDAQLLHSWENDPLLAESNTLYEPLARKRLPHAHCRSKVPRRGNSHPHRIRRALQLRPFPSARCRGACCATFVATSRVRKTDVVVHRALFF